MYTINNREVFWDMLLSEECHGVGIRNHTPVRKNIVMTLDEPWEGEHGGYLSLVKVGDTFRIYYRGGGSNSDDPQDRSMGTHSVFCVAESTDGKTFTKPSLGIYEYNGSKDNNIVFKLNKNVDNFSVYYDENPDCPEDEKFKALSSSIPDDNVFGKLGYYKSADGYHFEFVRTVSIIGAFDSLNLLLWDKDTGKYRIYLRDFHTPDGEDIPTGKHVDDSIRDIRYVESGDFLSWTLPKRVRFTDGLENIQYYTNGITKYYRANTFFGIPTRYIDRGDDAVNFKYLPNIDGFRDKIIAGEERRSGTAMTDCTVIYSRDGFLFERGDEPFCTAGIENHENWIYGDCYFGRGLFETASDYPYEPCEMSFYKCHGYRHRAVDVVRYTLRLDGFRSWHAGAQDAYILSKTVTLSGDSMSVNFETSALGYLRIIICDTDGNPIEGYDSTRLFGNSVERPVDFEKTLSELYGKEVRIRFEMNECELYSMNIE